MGEEEKKPEEPKTEEKKPEEKAAEEEKKGDEGEKEAPPPPPPPQEVVLKVYMHCEACARKVRRCLKGFDGVEDVITDCKSSKVVVKGEKAAADPLKVLNRIQRKSHRQVELISPIPKPPEPKEEVVVEEEKPKPEEKKEEPPKVIVVVIKVHMHCEACAQEIKKRIQRMKGVESAEPDLKSSEVAVKGVFDPSKLVEYVYKRTGKQVVIVKTVPEENKEEGGGDEKPKDDAPPTEEKKAEEAGGDGEKKEEGGGEGAAKAVEGGGETEETKVKINEYQYYPPRYAMELYAYPPPPQIFSDENPNACSVM